MKRHITTAIVLGGLAATLAAVNLPLVKRQARPTLVVDASPFSRGGCVAKERGWFDCPAGSLLATIGCHQIVVSSAFGGLSPTIAACLLHSEQEPPVTEFVHPPGGMSPLYTRFVLFEDGEYRLLKTRESLREQFAPITSREEALSFAVVATNLSLFYDFQPTDNLHYEVSSLEDTHVEVTTSGYVVHNLRADSVFGCGQHPTALVAVSVSTDGVVTLLSRAEVFRDPSMDDVCID